MSLQARRDVLLGNKVAVIYGGGGAVGGAVARAFAREGARLFLAGRTATPLQAVAEDVVAGVAEVWSRHADSAGVSNEQWWARMAEKTALRRLPMLADVANAAVLMASDHATAITAEVANVTCGELFD